MWPLPIQQCDSGDYYVVFDPATLPATYVFTNQGATGSSDPTDSDPDATGRTENINLSSGETDLTWDAGIVVNLASIGDRVFFDNNNNGTDDGEPASEMSRFACSDRTTHLSARLSPILRMVTTTLAA